MEASVITKLAIVQISPKRWIVCRLTGKNRFTPIGANSRFLWESLVGEKVFGPDSYIACQTYVSNHSEQVDW